MIDLSLVGWLTLAAAALLAWAALPRLWAPWRLCAAIASTVLTAVVMLHPPETIVHEAAIRPEPARAPPAPAPAQKAPAEAAMAPAAVEPPPPMRSDPCVALAGLKKEHCIACGDTTGLTRALCEGAAKSRYCSDKTGRDPDCPSSSTPSDPA